MSLSQAVALFAAAVVAGAINAVAGGGTLVTFPSLVFALGDPIKANATSTVALLPGSLSSMFAYRKDLKGTRGWVLLLTGPSLAGGILGAWLLLQTPATIFSRLVPYLILGATLLRAGSGRLNRWIEPTRAGPRSRTWRAAAVGFQFLVALYGGYFGAGIGIMMLAAFGLLGLTDIHQMNGLKCYLALLINGLAAAYFVWSGMVVWPYALLMMAGAVLGGFAGAAGARQLGKRFANAAVLVIGLGVGFWLLFRSH
jgi:uncharacterized membrane protein YfcA